MPSVSSELGIYQACPCCHLHGVFQSFSRLLAAPDRRGYFLPEGGLYIGYLARQRMADSSEKGSRGTY